MASGFQAHVMILGFNETGLEISDFFRRIGKDVVVCDLDPVLHKAFLFSYKGTAPRKEPRIGREEAANAAAAEMTDTGGTVSPDGVLIAGTNMGHSPGEISERSPRSKDGAIEMTSTPRNRTVVQAIPSAGGNDADKDLSALLQRFKLERDEENIRQNGINDTRELLDIDPEVLPDLVLTPVAKAKLKKLLRHVGASGWDAAQHHLPFLHHAKSLPAGVTQDDHGASSPEAFTTSGNVAFSSRSGVGISSPKPPRREESFKYSPYM